MHIYSQWIVAQPEVYAAKDRYRRIEDNVNEAVTTGDWLNIARVGSVTPEDKKFREDAQKRWLAAVKAVNYE